MQHNCENTQQGIHTLNEMVTEILFVKALADQDPYADKDRKETLGILHQIKSLLILGLSL